MERLEAWLRESWDKVESREAQALQVQLASVADFFQFCPLGTLLTSPRHSTGQGRFKVAEQSEWVSSDREAQKSTEG